MSTRRNCAPGMCEGLHTCADRQCPGHAAVIPTAKPQLRLITEQIEKPADASAVVAKGFPQNLNTLAWADDELELSAAEMLGYALIFLVIVAVFTILAVFVWALQ